MINFLLSFPNLLNLGDKEFLRDKTRASQVLTHSQAEDREQIWNQCQATATYVCSALQGQ